jgi:hypothetical protein
MWLVAAVGSTGVASASEPVPGRFSAALNGGVLVPANSGRGIPAFLGFTLSYWASEAFLIDASPSYILGSGGLLLLAGPRLRLGRGEVGVNLGLQVGPVLRQNLSPLFIVSLQAGVEARLSGGSFVGVGYAGDFSFYPSLSHRLVATLGHRF